MSEHNRAKHLHLGGMGQALLTAALLGCSAHAAEGQMDSQGVATRIGQARRQVLIYAPTLDVRSIAEALRKHIVGAQVKVFIIVPKSALSGNSYAQSLLFAGATVYVPKVKNADRAMPFVVIDNEEAILGPALVNEGTLRSSTLSRVSHDSVEVRGLINWVAAVAKAEGALDPLKFFVERYSKTLQKPSKVFGVPK